MYFTSSRGFIITLYCGNWVNIWWALKTSFSSPLETSHIQSYVFMFDQRLPQSNQTDSFLFDFGLWTPRADSPELTWALCLCWCRPAESHKVLVCLYKQPSHRAESSVWRLRRDRVSWTHSGKGQVTKLDHENKRKAARSMWRTQTIEIMFVPVDHVSRRIHMIPVKSQVRR